MTETSSRRTGSGGRERTGGTRVPVWARPERRPGLTREAIVQAAIAVADAEGLAAVSIRKVAAELGARTMSLYTHIDGKDDLLDLMRDEVTGEVLVDEELPADWRAAIIVVLRHERAAMLRHPWIVELIGLTGRTGPNGLRHVEQSMAALDGLGLDPRTAARIVRAVDHYMFGFVAQEVLTRKEPRRGGFIDEEWEVVRPYVDDLVATGGFPRLASLLEVGYPDVEVDFESGLNWLLDGIENKFT